MSDRLAKSQHTSENGEQASDSCTVVLTPEQSRDLLRRYLPEERAGDDALETLAQRLAYPTGRAHSN